MEEKTRAEGENSRKETIFSFFDRLNKSSNKSRSCAALVDFLKNNEKNIGSSSASLYTAKRLVRALAAPEPDKQGFFFSTLCTVLSMEVVTTADVLEALKNVVENTGSSKSERSSTLMTAVLTYGALISSDKVLQLTAEDQTVLSHKLVSASNSKQSFSGAATLFLIELVKKTSKTFFKQILLPALNKVLSHDKNLDDDFLAFVTFAYLKHTKAMQKLIDDRLNGRMAFLEEIATRGSHITTCLQEDIVKAICVDISLSGKAKQILQLWLKLIEKNNPHPAWDAYVLLFASVLLDIMPEADAIHKVLHTNLIDIVLRVFQVPRKKGSQDVVWTRAKAVLEKLTARVSNEEKKSEIALKVINKLLAHPSGLWFDKKTKSGTIQSLISCLEAAEIVHLADQLVEMMKESMEDQASAKRPLKDVPLLLSFLARIVSNGEIKKNTSFLTKYLKFTFDVAFLKSPLSSDGRTKVRDTFYKAVELCQVKLDDLVLVLNEIINHANNNLSNLTSPLSEASMNQWKDMFAANKKMETKSSDKKHTAMRALLLQIGLLIFKDEAIASSTIEELMQCYQRIREKKSKKKLEVSTSEGSTEPHWVEVTVDLLLAMLSRENKLLRTVVSAVFPSIVPDLTATAIQQIVDALDPSSRNDVLQHVDSESDDSDNEEEDNEAGSDEDNDFEDEDGEDEEEEDMDDEEETVNDKLRMAVRSALGYSAALTDDEDADMDDMNEEEEKRLNESLSNAFRLFRPSKGSKKKQSKDDEAVMHFRIRVLDLVEIVVTNSPPLSCCIELLDPLFALLEFTIKDSHQKPLQNRLESVLKKLGAVKKFSGETEVTRSDVAVALKKLFSIDTSAMVSIEMAPSITECSSLLLRASQVLPREPDGETIEKLFDSLLNRHFVLNDRKVPLPIFQHALRTLWDGNWSLSNSIMTLLLDPELKMFKKIKLLELLEIFYKNDRLQSTATDDCKKATSVATSKFVKKFTKMLEDCKKTTKIVPVFYSRIVVIVQLAMQSRLKYREACKPVPAWENVVSHLLDNLHLLPQQKARNKLLNTAQQCNLPIPDKETLKKILSSRKRPRGNSESAQEEEQEVNQDGDEKEPKKAKSAEKEKKKSDKDAKKLRKESKKRRNLASSEGLEEVTFTGVNASELLDDSDSEEPAVKKPKKKTPKKEKEAE